jgi:hypothetical protein
VIRRDVRDGGGKECVGDGMAAVRGKMETELTVGAIDPVDQLPHDYSGLGAECAHDVDEFDDAESALAALILGDKRLRLCQPLGDLSLRQMLTHAEVPQQGTQLPMPSRAS